VEDDILKDMKSLKALSTPQLTALVSMSLDFLTSTDGAYVRGVRRRACMHAPRACCGGLGGFEKTQEFADPKP